MRVHELVMLDENFCEDLGVFRSAERADLKLFRSSKHITNPFFNHFLLVEDASELSKHDLEHYFLRYNRLLVIYAVSEQIKNSRRFENYNSYSENVYLQRRLSEGRKKLDQILERGKKYDLNIDLSAQLFEEDDLAVFRRSYRGDTNQLAYSGFGEGEVETFRAARDKPFKFRQINNIAYDETQPVAIATLCCNRGFGEVFSLGIIAFLRRSGKVVFQVLHALLKELEKREISTLTRATEKKCILYKFYKIMGARDVTSMEIRTKTT